jgi:PAS domain S-box-containing protein
VGIREGGAVSALRHAEGPRKRSIRAELILALVAGLLLASPPRGYPEEGVQAEPYAGTPESMEFLASLTEAERGWIRAHPLIRVVQDPGWPPVEFEDARGRPSGMSADYLVLVERKLGIKLERVRGLSWQEAYARLRRREIDMTTSVAVTPERLGFWAFTEPYLRIPIVIATGMDVTYIADMKELFGKKVAVVSGYAVEDWIPRDFPRIELVGVDSAQKGLELLQRGEVFAYVDNLLIIGDYQAKMKVTQIKIAGQTPYENAQRMAVRKDWAPLAAILEKALASITEEERGEIYRKWLPLRYEQGFDYALLWRALAAFAVVVALLLLWNRKLAREIRSRRLAEAALRDASWRLESIIEGTRAGTWEWNVRTGETVFNEAWAEVVGYSLAELAPVSIKTWEGLVHPDDLRASLESLERHFAGEQPLYDCECRMRRKDGSWAWVHDRGRVVTRDGEGKPLMMFGTRTDITERKVAEEQIRRSLAEKEVLLREVHHRVKNNLNIISSLLSLQSSAILSPDQALAAFTNSRNRIMAMALVHEELYLSKDYASVDMGQYLGRLTGRLLKDREPSGGIVASAEAEGLFLGVDIALPCGLILNELISNALRHAFPEGKGEIRILARESIEGRVELSVSDDGIGIPEGREAGEAGTLGLTLVGLLVEQLGGTMEIRRSGGTSFAIRFPARQVS